MYSSDQMTLVNKRLSLVQLIRRKMAVAFYRLQTDICAVFLRGLHAITFRDL